MFFKYTRKELKNLSSSQFKEGDVVKCGKYYIHIRYGKYDIPSLMTTVSSEDSFADLPIHKHPYYVREFISRRLEEVTC